MEDVSLVRYSPETSDLMRTAQLIECYRDVFADEPWHEWLKCAHCDKYWGVKDKALLASWQYQHCGGPLVDFWPRENVLADLHHEITESALCSLALAGERVVGFCWGYPMEIGALEKKVGLIFGGTLEVRFGTHERVGYQDEVGVLSAYRGKKIARVMNKDRILAFEKSGLKIAISRVRRSPEPSVTFLWYTGKLGYDVLAEYPDGRVILGRHIKGLVDLL